MKTIRLENFRSLGDTDNIEIKPITLLLGQNSSGKSTFLRSFALLKQGVSVRAREPFLWVGELVDFGGVSETLSNFSESDRLSLTYEFELPRQVRILKRRFSKEEGSADVSVSISERAKSKEGEAAFEYEVVIDKERFDFSITRDGDIVYFAINKIEYTFLMSHMSVRHWKGPVPVFSLKASGDALKALKDDGEIENTFINRLQKFVRKRSHGRTGQQKINEFASWLTIVPLASFASARGQFRGDTVWQKNTQSWTKRHPDFREFNNLVLGCRFLDFMHMVSEYSATVLEQSKYITPLRATAERYYRKQGLAVDELDAQGRNFALFLNNMSKHDQDEFSAWCEAYFNVEIEVLESGGHLSVYISSSGGGERSRVNIADTGFGFSQMFPILAQLWAARKGAEGSKGVFPVIFSIEQPELHLHPKLQANLADVFVSSVKAAKYAGIELKLIIETHSEYLINRLGYLIAKDKFESGDAAVLIFDRSSHLESTEITHANFNPKGFLENWPHGFFEPVAL
ncbi:AAA family ATPase [Pseudomonas viridiflava]|uniref:AAA family ATPase n=1 Tax=Pseudomonas viridiflava TaxID=33069 RepID=UPI000F01F5CC|nr:AAA family ATPase [Pseudomonas viridiflava]